MSKKKLAQYLADKQDFEEETRRRRYLEEERRYLAEQRRKYLEEERRKINLEEERRRRQKMAENTTPRGPAQVPSGGPPRGPTPAPSGGTTPTTRSGTSTPSRVTTHSQGMEPTNEEIPVEKESQQNESKINNFNINHNDLDESVDDSSETNYVFTLTDTDSVPAAGDNYHKIITEQKKEAVKYMKFSKDLSEALKNILNSATYSSSQWEENRNKVNDHYRSLNDKIKEEEIKLKDVSTLSNEFKQTLQQPVFGSNDDLNIEEARLAVPLFSDENGCQFARILAKISNLH